MDDSQPEHTDMPSRERGSSGFGTMVGYGTAAIATVGAVALLASLNVATPVIFAVVAGLGLLGGGLLVAQHHKEKANDANAYRRYSQTEGYHKEPDAVTDPSLMHLMKGRSDLPERVQYIKEHYGEYGIDPVSKSQFRGKYLGTGLALGALAAGVVMAGIAALTVGTFGVPALAFAGVMGALAGGTALAAHTAHTMRRYDEYVDSLAAEGEARKQKADQSPAPAAEYDNGCGRKRTFCDDVSASRRPIETVQVCR